MSLKVNTGIHFAAASMSWGRLISHNERKFTNHKSDTINSKYTDTNIYKTFFNWRKVWAPRVAGYVKHHNNLKSVKHNPSRRITVKQLLDRKRKQITRCGIITLGNTQFRKEYEKKDKNIYKMPAEERDKENNSLIDYIKDFNKRHKRVKVCEACCHGDETFIHAHVLFMGLPNYKTKSKRPAFSFSRALKQDMKCSTTPTAMRHLHREEKPRLVAAFEEPLEPKLIPKINKEPKGSNSLSASEYKRSAIKSDQSLASLQASSAEVLRSTAASLNSRAYSEESKAEKDRAKAKSKLEANEAKIAIANLLKAKNQGEYLDLSNQVYLSSSAEASKAKSRVIRSAFANVSNASRPTSQRRLQSQNEPNYNHSLGVHGHNHSGGPQVP